MTFGAMPENRTAWSTICGAAWNSIGLVCTERRPCRPAWTSNTGSSSRAPLIDMSSTTAQARSDTLEIGALEGKLRNPLAPEAGILGPHVDDDRGVCRRPDRTVAERVFELVDRARVVPDVGGGLRDGPAQRTVGEGQAGDADPCGHPTPLCGATSRLKRLPAAPLVRTNVASPITSWHSLRRQPQGLQPRRWARTARTRR